jgi:hypothetical protein
MSVKIMGGVWTLDLKANKLLVLLAMADHADDDGNNVFPSINLIAWKTGYSDKQVRRIIKALLKDGLLKMEKESKGRFANSYSIHLDKGKPKPPREIEPSQNVRDEYAKPSQDVQVQPGQNGSVAHSQPGHFDPVNLDIAMSTKPSLEPSIKESARLPKSDPVFSLIACEAFGIESKVSEPNVRGRINGLCKTARTTFEDQFGRMDEEKLCNAIKEFYKDCDKQNWQRPTGRGTFGSRFAGFLQKRAKAAKNKVIALPVNGTNETPTAEEIEMKKLVEAGISQLAEKMRGA